MLTDILIVYLAALYVMVVYNKYTTILDNTCTFNSPITLGCLSYMGRHNTDWLI